MLDDNELKFGDLLVEKGYDFLYVFLEYYPRTLSIKLLKIPSDIYIPSVPVWKPDYESFMRSDYVRDHRIFRPISYMDYADPYRIKKHNDKANHNLNLGKWLYNCSLYPMTAKRSVSLKELAKEYDCNCNLTIDWFENINFKEKETKDMSRNVMLKNIVGSDIYVKMNDGSNDVVYIGRGEGLDFEVSYDDGLTGTISFVADDEPLSDELRKISRSFIKKVIFNNPATIVFWRDGSKTIVKMNGKDKKFDPEKGLAMAIAKKCLGNEGNYYNTFTKFLPEEKAGKKSAKK